MFGVRCVFFLSLLHRHHRRIASLTSAHRLQNTFFSVALHGKRNIFIRSKRFGISNGCGGGYEVGILIERHLAIVRNPQSAHSVSERWSSFEDISKDTIIGTEIMAKKSKHKTNEKKVFDLAREERVCECTEPTRNILAKSLRAV